MHKILDCIDKELHEVEEKGLNVSNLEPTYRLIKMRKLILEMEEDKEEEKEMRYRGYDRRYYDHDTYGRRDRRDDSETYYDKADRMIDALDDYCYGRMRYRDGGSNEHMVKGLEDLMYAVCTFIEHLADNTETPAGKEIIRKHINKLTKI